MINGWGLKGEASDGRKTREGRKVESGGGWIRGSYSFVRKGICFLIDDVFVYRSGTVMQILYRYDDGSGKDVVQYNFVGGVLDGREEFVIRLAPGVHRRL